MVDASIHPRALIQQRGKLLQLHHGASAFAFDAAGRQRRLGLHALDQLVTKMRQTIGNGAQQSGSLLRLGCGKRRRCRTRGFTSALDLIGTGLGVSWF